jgi:hypothetical protein
MRSERSRACAALLPLLLCHCGTDGFFEVISPAAPGAGTAGCSGATRGSVSSIEVGERVFLDDGTVMFAPLDDGSMATIVRGVQGADMLVLGFRVTGAGGQTCLVQRTDVTDEAGGRLSYNAVSTSFQEQPDGSSVSEWIYFPGPYVPGPVTIEVSLGGRTLVRHVDAVQ